MVIGLGAVFIFLTFHEGDKNYVSPVLHGVLKWTSVGSYLSLDVFFRQPYLAGWALGMAGLYYVLFRLGHELQMIKWVGVLAALYCVINLQELARFRFELAVLDVWGILSVALGLRRRQSTQWGMALVPWLLMATGFFLFGQYDTNIAHPNSDFLVMVGIGGALFGCCCWLAWRQGVQDAWLVLSPFVVSVFLLLVTANYPLSGNYRNLMLLGLTLPRYFVGELLVVVLLGVMVAIYCKWRPKGNLIWLDVVGLAAVGLAFLDLRLTQIMNVRLDWQVLTFADSPKMMWRMARPYLPVVLFTLVLVAAAYAAVLWFSTRRMRLMVLRHDTVWNGLWFAITALLVGLTGMGFGKADKGEGQVLSSLIETSPWWQRVSQPIYPKDDFVQAVRELGLGSMLATPTPGVPSGEARDLNVVLIFQESVYNCHLSLFGCTNETQPLLSQYKDRMELFPNFFSNWAGSIHARFATFTGLYPVQDFKAFTKNTVPVESLFEVLRDHGYDCSVFYSSFIDYTNFRDFLRGHGVAHMYDADTMPGTRTTAPVSWGLNEEETLTAINHQIGAYATNGQKFFLTYVPAAPHYPFDGTPEQFMKFKLEYFGDFTPKYMNELLYMDSVIAQIVGQLKESGLLDRTLVVITADHGEMLGGHGTPIGHGWAITPELANVPLIVMDPGKKGGRVNPVIGSQVDLLPTILDLLRIPLPPSELYQGTSLYQVSNDQDRTFYLNSFRQFAEVHGGQIFVGDRNLGPGQATQVFSIANTGATPGFIPSDSTNALPVSIDQFEHFQESFLRHYADYRTILREP
jgi:phosphoglycerol transferase MdoB-like AlkP superfamily enzyme